MLHLGISLIDIYQMLVSFFNNAFKKGPKITLNTCLALGGLTKDRARLKARFSEDTNQLCINDIYFLSTLMHFCRASSSMYGYIGSKYNLGYRMNYIPVYSDLTRLRLISCRLLQSAIGATPTAGKIPQIHNKNSHSPVEYCSENSFDDDSVEDFLLSTLNSTQNSSIVLNIDDNQRILDMKKRSKALSHKKRTVSIRADSEMIVHAVDDPNIRTHEFIGSQDHMNGVCYDYCDATTTHEYNHFPHNTLLEYTHSSPHDFPLCVDRLYRAFNTDYPNTLEHNQASEYLKVCKNDLYAFVTEMGITTDQVLLFHVTNTAFETYHCLYIDPYRREIVVAIRGTMSVGDIKVDLTVGYARVTRPPPAYENIIGSCMDLGANNQAATARGRTASAPSRRRIPKKLRNKLFKDHLVDYSDKSMENGLYAHQGIYLASSNLFYTIKPYIEQLFSIVEDQQSFNAYFKNEYALSNASDKPYTFVFTGHSLGAGVAALLGYFFRPLLKDRLRVYGFGAPPTVSLPISKELEMYSYQIALERDVVCRLSLGAIQTTLWRASLREEIQKRGLVNRITSILESTDSLTSSEYDDIGTFSLQPLHELSDEDLLHIYTRRITRLPQDRALTLYIPGTLLILEFCHTPDSTTCPQSLADVTKLCSSRGTFDLRGQRFAQLYKGNHESVNELIISKDMWSQHLMYFEYLLLVYYSLFPISDL